MGFVIYQDGRFRSKRDSRKGGINFDHIIAAISLDAFARIRILTFAGFL